MHVDLWIWAAFVAFILVMLAVDLFGFHRKAHVVSVKESLVWTGVWVTLGLLFGVVIWLWQGPVAAGEYLSGYLIEKSLSVDNIFVFALIFGTFAVPAAYQHRVLFWGVLGALVFRAIFIGIGAYLVARFHWIQYVFGAFLLWTGFKMLRHDEIDVDLDRNVALRLLRRFLPMTGQYEGAHFFVRQGGRLLATPLLAVLAVVETCDIVFAVDSIPAIFGITHDPFLVFTSNAFAILGLRALYFLLASMMGRFVHLKAGVSLILLTVGVKMLLVDVWKVPIWLSLSLIGLLLAGSILLSLKSAPPPPPELPPPPLPKVDSPLSERPLPPPPSEDPEPRP